MVKYILCIFLGAFLMLGFNHILNEEMQKCRSEAGSVEIQPHIKSNLYTSTAVSQQECKENHTIKTEKYTCKAGDAIPGNILISRNIVPLKILKLHTSATTIRILSSLDSQLPEKRWKGITFDTPLIEYSNRYYIYTLERILI